MERRRLPPFLYDALQKFVHGDYAELRSILGPAYHPYSDRPALELGCGTGTLSRLFDKDKYVGIDLDAARIAVAREKHPGYEFVVGDASNLDSAFIARFGFVFCHAWVHHIDDESVRRILDSIASSAKKLDRALNLLVMEPLLPDHFLQNPVGFALGKLDRGRYVRPRAAMERLLGEALVKTDVSRINWVWPVPGASFHLRYS